MGEIAENRGQIRHFFVPNGDTYEKYEIFYCSLPHSGQKPLSDFQNSSPALHNNRRKIMTNIEKTEIRKIGLRDGF